MGIAQGGVSAAGLMTQRTQESVKDGDHSEFVIEDMQFAKHFPSVQKLQHDPILFEQPK